MFSIACCTKKAFSLMKACCPCLQEVQKLDLGANASSGTSNEEDDAMADDGDDWSDEQATALQVPFLGAAAPHPLLMIGTLDNAICLAAA